MPEYITKEQAIDEVWDAFTSHDDPDLGRVIEENIKRLPAADVAPVVRARWEACKVGPMNAYACSNCGLIVIERNIPLVKYCPQCGSRMDGDDNA